MVKKVKKPAVFHTFSICPKCKKEVKRHWAICENDDCDEVLINLDREKREQERKEKKAVGSPGRKKTQRKAYNKAISIMDRAESTEVWNEKIAAKKKKKRVRPNYDKLVNALKGKE